MAASTKTTVRWGMLGCGLITNDFVNAMKNSETSVLTACAARSLESAQKFAAAHGFARAYGSYEELCADPEVDIVYISTIHIMHYEHTLLALKHGKNVLVEKPMTMNAKQAAHVISIATEKKLFLMEGMWTRFFPAIRYIRKLLADGVIGDVHHVNADIGFAPSITNDRLWKRSLGGGALLDLGIYPIALSTMVFGATPKTVSAVGKLSEGGVDAFGSVTLEFSNATFATVQFSILGELPDALTINGSNGRIQIATHAHFPSEVSLFAQLPTDSEPTFHVSKFPLPTTAPNATPFNFGPMDGMLYESEAVNEALLSHRLQHPEYPLDESLAIMKIMDAIRAQLGVVYDQDQN